MDERIIRIGDTVMYIGGDSSGLAINTGDLGVVVRGPTDWAEDSLSVHFRKWDGQGGSHHPEGVDTHHVNGVEAFYIGSDDLKRHAPYCMFKEETRMT